MTNFPKKLLKKRAVSFTEPNKNPSPEEVNTTTSSLTAQEVIILGYDVARKGEESIKRADALLARFKDYPFLKHSAK